MGGNNSILTTEQLDEYVELTYLTKSEILYILEKFKKLGASEIASDIHFRFHISLVMKEFPQLKYNPYRDRLIKVFSSLSDEHYSFEDFLDLVSVMSENCPLNVKAAWAFRVFDFNEDNQITKSDIFDMLDRLTRFTQLAIEEKDHISEVLMEEMDLQHSGGLNQFEFLHAISKIPDFVHAFQFKV